MRVVGFCVESGSSSLKHSPRRTQRTHETPGLQNDGARLDQTVTAWSKRINILVYPRCACRILVKKRDVKQSGRGSTMTFDQISDFFQIASKFATLLLAGIAVRGAQDGGWMDC